MNRHAPAVRPTRPGMAMMYAILVVAIAAIVAYGYVASQSTSVAIGRNINSHARARMLAESGLELAMAYIRANDDWRTVQSSGAWLTDEPLGEGMISVTGEDGIDTDNDGSVDGDGDLGDDPADLLTLVVTGRVNGTAHVLRAVATPIAVPVTPLLFVVQNPDALTAEEQNRVDLFEAWGYKVTAIGSNDSQTDFADAIADSALIYIPGSVNPAFSISKVKGAEIGLVNETAGLYDDLGVSSSSSTFNGNAIDIVDTAHEITSAFATGPLTIFTMTQSMSGQTGTVAAGADVLAERVSSDDATLTIVEKAETLVDGSIASGRRVTLPWASATFDVDTLTADGRTLLKNALDWAASESGIAFVHMGHMTEYTLEQGGLANTQVATQVTLAEDATLTAISAYVKGPIPKELRYAIYDDSGGEPGNLIAQTAATPVRVSDYAWQTISIGPVALNAGTYWLALAFEHTNMYYKYAAGGQTRAVDHFAVKNGFTAPWGTSDTSPSQQVSIYGIATTEPTGEVEPPPVIYIYTVDWQ